MESERNRFSLKVRRLPEGGRVPWDEVCAVMDDEGMRAVLCYSPESGVRVFDLGLDAALGLSDLGDCCEARAFRSAAQGLPQAAWCRFAIGSERTFDVRHAPLRLTLSERFEPRDDFGVWLKGFEAVAEVVETLALGSSAKGGGRRSLLGAVAGDIIGSRFEWKNHKSKEFRLFDLSCAATDDSVLTVAVASAIRRARAGEGALAELTAQALREAVRAYPHAGYGARFGLWAADESAGPYGSCGNGSAMRASACGYAASTLEEAAALAETTAAVTHNHPDGIAGAVATAKAVFLARSGASKADIKAAVEGCGYPLSRRLDEIRPGYRFEALCAGTVPPAVQAFLESEDYPDAIRNAISLGGDSDTLAAIAGAIAGAFYGIPEPICAAARLYLHQPLRAELDRFDGCFCR
ncbi:MAG: ADP-ribosylglycohydrolase family protein [Kiritimatiellia bacterium]